MKNTKGNITQSRLNKTKKLTINRSPRYQSVNSIPTKQLSLFGDAPAPAPAPHDDESPPSYQLQIIYVPHDKRIKPNEFCKLVHHASGLTIKGQFSYEQALYILETTRDWDWKLDRHKIPRCAETLRSLIESVVAEGGDLS